MALGCYKDAELPNETPELFYNGTWRSTVTYFVELSIRIPFLQYSFFRIFQLVILFQAIDS